jgi:GNAT superfamily N-acetyltransferase
MIRKATPADASRLVEMAGHFVEQTRYSTLFRFKPAAVAQLVALVLEHGVIFVAEQDGAIVGMLAALPMEEPIAKTPMLDEMAWWVEPAFRRGSVGPKLLRAAESWAVQKGLRLVKMVAPVGTNVGDYYKRMGYTEVETSWVKKLVSGNDLRLSGGRNHVDASMGPLTAEERITK